MPINYDYTQSAYRIDCTRCTTSVVTSSPSSRGAIDTITGRPVSDFFAWHSGQGRTMPMCRACARSRAAARRAAGTPRRATATRGIALGLTRKFGVEMELIFPRTTSRDRIGAALLDAGLSGWRVKSDGSLNGGPRGTGWEIVSPVLSGQGGLDQIEKACRVVRELGASVNRSCGLHVHHDVADLNVDALKNVARGWVNNRPLIDGLVAESRREGGSYYCRPLGSADLGRITAASNINDMRRLSIDRYRTLNYAALGRYGTIEVRQHQGTFNFEKIRSWLLLGQAIIDTAVTTGAAAPAHSRMRDLLTAFGERLDETARTFLLGRTVEFNYATV